jgi:hypothetical protein
MIDWGGARANHIETMLDRLENCTKELSQVVYELSCLYEDDLVLDKEETKMKDQLATKQNQLL